MCLKLFKASPTQHMNWIGICMRMDELECQDHEKKMINYVVVKVFEMEIQNENSMKRICDGG